MQCVNGASDSCLMLDCVRVINFHVVVVIVIINIGEYDANFNSRKYLVCVFRRKATSLCGT